MATASYLEKYAFCDPLVSIPPHPDLGIVVAVILAHAGQMEALVGMLQACEPPACAVELLLIPPYLLQTNGKAALVSESVSNRDEGAIDEDLRQNAILWNQSLNPGHMAVHVLSGGHLPTRKRGLGTARKLGMDEAVRRLNAVNKPDGVIACLDGDAQVESNYLAVMCQHFKNHQRHQALKFSFEMPAFVEGTVEEHNRKALYHELHWRYYNLACGAAGFPISHHSMGTVSALRNSAYQKHGGMHPGKDAPDFHFYRNIAEIGALAETNETLVKPGRMAVNFHYNPPFSTADSKGYFTFHPQGFRYLRTFFKHVPEFYLISRPLEHLGGELPYIMIDFLSAYFFDERIDEIRSNSRGYNSFERRFYQWFNAAMVFKFVQFVRDNVHPSIRVEIAAVDLLRSCGYKKLDSIRSFHELLTVYRTLDGAPRRTRLRLP